MDRRLEGEPLIDDSCNANYASYSTFWHTTLKLFSSSDERTDLRRRLHHLPFLPPRVRRPRHRRRQGLDLKKKSDDESMMNDV